MHLWIGLRGQGTTRKAGPARGNRDSVENHAQRSKKRASAVVMFVPTVEAQRASALIFHSQLAEVATCSDADAYKARMQVQDAQAHLVDADQEAAFARKDLNKV